MFRRPAPSGDRGASAVEYSLFAVAVAAVIVGVIFALGGYVRGQIASVCDEVRTSTSATQCPP